MNNIGNKSLFLAALVLAGTATAQLPPIDPNDSVGRFVTHVSSFMGMTTITCPAQVYAYQAAEVGAVTCTTSTLDDVDFVLSFDEAALASNNPLPIAAGLTDWEFEGGFMAARVIFFQNDEVGVVVFNMDTDVASFSQMD